MGAVQRGSTKMMVRGRGVAHIGDAALCPLPPEMTVTGLIAGTLTFAIPAQGTIEQGSSNVKADGRGHAHIGDTALFFFPALIPFVGTIAGLPFTVPVAVLQPVRGFIKAGAPVRAS